MLALKSVLFALLIPGTVTVLVPYWLLSRSRTSWGAPWSLFQLLGLVPVAIGAAILARCIWDFAVAGRGTLAHIDPPKRLVARGLYRYVRNPMYVGGLAMLLGEALTFRSLAILEWAGIWFTFISAVVVFYEEPALERQFGDSYLEYRRTVPRWIPRPPNGFS